MILGKMKRAIVLFIITLSLIYFSLRYFSENRILKEVIERLEADSRIAEVLVSGVNYNEKDKKIYTTIKFLEYDTVGKPLEPKYFTFSGNIIQFQSLLIRFDDLHIRRGSALKGKSAYLFWKVFLLSGPDTQEYEINKVDAVPEGYKIKVSSAFEQKLWEKFWKYALEPQERKNIGIKSAQIEAPGVMFIPGVIYTLKIEHDGGIRIDSQPLPEILKGEKIPG